MALAVVDDLLLLLLLLLLYHCWTVSLDVGVFSDGGGGGGFCWYWAVAVIELFVLVVLGVVDICDDEDDGEGVRSERVMFVMVMGWLGGGEKRGALAERMLSGSAVVWMISK